jgi:hypothetical protein
MLYVGHFSFDEIGPEDEIRHGYFTCIAEAEDPDGATDKFKEYLVGLKGSDELFEGVVAIYIEDIIEIQKLPKTPFITRLQSSPGEFPESVSISLPSGDNPELTAYGWGPDVEEENKGEEVVETQPFLQFDEE